jgi:hypothetical protein
MSATLDERREVPAVHQPFTWTTSPELEKDGRAAFLALTMDVSRGIETCLQLVNSSNLERHGNTMADPGEEIPPILNRIDTENLLRLAIASARMLATESEHKLRYMDDTAGRKGVA